MDNIPRSYPNCWRCRQDYSTEAASPQLPLLLSCGHSLCRQCVGELHADEPSHVRVSWGAAGEGVSVRGVDCGKGCPATPLVAGEELPPHAELVAEMRCAVYRASVQACEECEARASESWCATCDTSLCGACFSLVHAPKVMRRHQPVPLAERPYPVALCEEHGHPVTYFCNACQVQHCGVCKEDSHSQEGHVVVDLQAAANTAVDRTRRQLHAMSEKRDSLGMRSLSVQSALAGLSPGCEVAEAKIALAMEALREQVMSAIAEQQGRLVQQCRRVRASKSEQLHDERDSVASALSAVMATRQLCQDMLGAHPVALLAAEKSLASKIGGVNSACACVSDDPVADADIAVTFSDTHAQTLADAVLEHGEVGHGACPRITASKFDPRAATPTPHTGGGGGAATATATATGKKRERAAGAITLPAAVGRGPAAAAELRGGHGGKKRLKSLAGGARDLLPRRATAGSGGAAAGSAAAAATAAAAAAG